MQTKPEIAVQIFHIQDPLKGEIQEFTDPEIWIGRHPSCQICFPKGLAIISRRHAKIEREGNRFKLIDQSTNGNFVNGKDPGPADHQIRAHAAVLQITAGGHRTGSGLRLRAAAPIHRIPARAHFFSARPVLDRKSHRQKSNPHRPTPGRSDHPLQAESRLSLSSQGPRFRFFGAARLAEIEETVEKPEGSEPQALPASR